MRKHLSERASTVMLAAAATECFPSKLLELAPTCKTAEMLQPQHTQKVFFHHCISILLFACRRIPFSIPEVAESLVHSAMK